MKKINLKFLNFYKKNNKIDRNKHSITNVIFKIWFNLIYFSHISLMNIIHRCKFHALLLSKFHALCIKKTRFLFNLYCCLKALPMT